MKPWGYQVPPRICIRSKRLEISLKVTKSDTKITKSDTPRLMTLGGVLDLHKKKRALERLNL
jgi:hypothetical protein